MKLYEIPVAWAAIEQELVEGLGEVTPDLESRMSALIAASKDKLTAAGLVKRNLELHEEMAKAQAGVFQDEAARVAGMAKAFGTAADRLGAIMAPALKTVGSIKTVAGTLYATRRVTYAITLKPGMDIKALPKAFWRQAEPELNKKPIQDLCKVHPVTPEQMEFVAGGDFKLKDLERIRKDQAVTDADLEVLRKDGLTPDQLALLDAIQAVNEAPTEIAWARSESLTSCLKAAKASEPEAQATPEIAPAQPAPAPVPDPAFDPFLED